MKTKTSLVVLSFIALFLAACSFQPVTQPNQGREGELDTQANFYGILGGAVDVVPSQDARNSAIVLDSNDKPVIAWSECFTSCQLYVKRWNGTSWALLSGSLNINTSQRAINPSLALDKSGFPVVSWEEVASSSSLSKIYVKRWNGSNWVQVGAALNIFANRSATDPSLALDTLGNPIVGFSQRNNNTISPSFDIRVKQWNGSIWTDVGVGVSAILDVFPEKDAMYASLAVDSSGNLIVGWTQMVGASGSAAFYVKRWNGSTWIQLGDEVPSFLTLFGVPMLPTKLVIDLSGNPMVAIKDYVRRWNGSEWIKVGGDNRAFADSSGVTDKSDLELDSLNRPLISAGVCRERDISGCINFVVRVKRWNNSTGSWEPIGTDWNVDSARDAFDADIAIDSNNRPVVSFEECAEYFFDEENRKRCINYDVYTLRLCQKRLSTL